MSRTDLDPATLAASLRRTAGDPYDSDGSVEWVYEPIQATVLLDIADALDENAKLRKVCKRMRDHIKDSCDVCDEYYCSSWDEDNECCVFDTYMRELGVEVDG